MLVPHVFEQPLSSEHFARVHHEVTQQRELLGGERDRAAPVTRFVPRRVEFERPDDEHRAGAAGIAPQEGADPCRELAERKRLHEVVVGAGVEAGDPVVEEAAGGEDEHAGRGVADRALSEVTAQGHAVDVGQAEIETDQVVLVHPEARVGGGAVVGDVDRVALPPQAGRHGVGQIGFVLHHQNAHSGCST